MIKLRNMKRWLKNVRNHIKKNFIINVENAYMMFFYNYRLHIFLHNFLHLLLGFLIHNYLIVFLLPFLPYFEFTANVIKTFKIELNERGCVGSIAEIYDSKRPYEPKGAFFLALLFSPFQISFLPLYKAQPG